MDGYTLIIGVLLLGAALSVATVIGWIAFALIRSRKDLKQGAVRPALMWAGLATLPFVLFGLAHAGIAIQGRIRADRLAALTRTPLGPDRPRVLEVFGWITDAEIGALLGSGLVDEVYRIQDRGFERETVDAEIMTFQRTPACQTDARTLLADQVRGHRDSTLWRRVEDCVSTSRQTLTAASRAPASIVLLMGHATTLKKGHTLKMGGNLELRVRQAGQDLLVDYWEDAYVEKPVSPFLLGPGGFFSSSGGGPRVAPRDRLLFVAAPLGLARTDLKPLVRSLQGVDRRRAIRETVPQ